MQGTSGEGQELTSLNQLIQELIDGKVRRSTFTQWELELLLDLQTCRVRKSSRSEMLRRYLRAVQLQYAKNPAFPPLRFSVFLGWDSSRRNLPDDDELQAAASGLSPGISSS